MSDFDFEGEDNYFEAMMYMAHVLAEEEEQGNANKILPTRPVVQQKNLSGVLFDDNCDIVDVGGF